MNMRGPAFRFPRQVWFGDVLRLFTVRRSIWAQEARSSLLEVRCLSLSLHPPSSSSSCLPPPPPSSSTPLSVLLLLLLRHSVAALCCSTALHRLVSTLSRRVMNAWAIPGLRQRAHCEFGDPRDPAHPHEFPPLPPHTLSLPASPTHLPTCLPTFPPPHLLPPSSPTHDDGDDDACLWTTSDERTTRMDNDDDNDDGGYRQKDT